MSDAQKDQIERCIDAQRCEKWDDGDDRVPPEQILVKLQEVKRLVEKDTFTWDEYRELYYSLRDLQSLALQRYQADPGANLKCPHPEHHAQDCDCEGMGGPR